MDDTDTEYSGNMHSLMVEDTRLNFFQLENWMTSLDLKSSIMIAVDAILVSTLEPITHFSQQIPILQLLIITPLFLSVIMALFCLWPRSWPRPVGMSTINDYSDKRFDYAASKLARNYAEGEKKLKVIYEDKFEYFQISIVLTMISLGTSFILILNQFFGA
jgi:hypothetical protein